MKKLFAIQEQLKWLMATAFGYFTTSPMLPKQSPTLGPRRSLKSGRLTRREANEIIDNPFSTGYTYAKSSHNDDHWLIPRLSRPNQPVTEDGPFLLHFDQPSLKLATIPLLMLLCLVVGLALPFGLSAFAGGSQWPHIFCPMVQVGYLAQQQQNFVDNATTAVTNFGAMEVPVHQFALIAIHSADGQKELTTSLAKQNNGDGALSKICLQDVELVNAGKASQKGGGGTMVMVKMMGEGRRQEICMATDSDFLSTNETMMVINGSDTTTGIVPFVNNGAAAASTTVVPRGEWGERLRFWTHVEVRVRPRIGRMPMSLHRGPVLSLSLNFSLPFQFPRPLLPMLA